MLSLTESTDELCRWLKRVGLLNLLFLGLMSVYRLVFFFMFAPMKELKGLGHDVSQAFILGARFDLSALCYLNILPLLVLLLMSVVRSEKQFDSFAVVGRWYYLLMFFLVSVISWIDIGFYTYFQDRINILIFAFFTDDTMALVRTFWRNYPVIWIFLALLIYAAAIYWAIRKILQINKSQWRFSSQRFFLLNFAFIFLPIVFLGIGARGSFNMYPLGVMDTAISPNTFVNHLAFGSLHAFERAWELRQEQSKTRWDSNMAYYGYSDPRQAFADFYDLPLAQIPADPLSLMMQKTPKNEWAAKTKPHVVLFVMEGMGAYWFQFNNEKFNLLGEFAKHTKEDSLLLNFLPSTGSTIGSISGFLVDMPHRPEGPFLTESDYLQVPFSSSPARIFKSAGYYTRYIYGGNPGWRDVNKFARFQGFDSIEGQVDMQRTFNLDDKVLHDWGIYDEHVFNYVYKILREATQPQFIVVLTTSNHPPYTVPVDFKALPQDPPKELVDRYTADPELIKGRFKTYQYANQKLGEFMTRLKASPLRDHTVVGATGDHGFWIVNFSEQEILQKWSVPFYLYTPKEFGKKLDPSIFASHQDILPTLYGVSLSEVSYPAFGADLFNLKRVNSAIHFDRTVLSGAGGVFANRKGEERYFTWAEGMKLQASPAPIPEMEKLANRYRAEVSLIDYYFKVSSEHSSKQGQ